MQRVTKKQIKKIEESADFRHFIEEMKEKKAHWKNGISTEDRARMVEKIEGGFPAISIAKALNIKPSFVYSWTRSSRKGRAPQLRELKILPDLPGKNLSKNLRIYFGEKVWL